MEKTKRDSLIEDGFEEINKRELLNYARFNNAEHQPSREIYIEVTNENNDVLLCKNTLEKAYISMINGRFIIHDIYNTYFFNIKFDSIINCMRKKSNPKFSGEVHEILFSIENQNIDYKIQIHMDGIRFYN